MVSYRDRVWSAITVCRFLTKTVAEKSWNLHSTISPNVRHGTARTSSFLFGCDGRELGDATTRRHSYSDRSCDTLEDVTCIIGRAYETVSVM